MKYVRCFSVGASVPCGRVRVGVEDVNTSDENSLSHGSRDFRRTAAVVVAIEAGLVDAN